MKRHIAALGALLCLSGIAAAQESEAPKPIRVLMIGNSYTMFNDMPATLAEMGRSLGHDISVDVAAVGGKSLSYHRRSAKTLAAIASQPWDVVVLQDHSLVPSRCTDDVRRHSLPDVRALARRIRANRSDTRIVFYETWGRRETDDHTCTAQPATCTFDSHTSALQHGYRLYRQATNADVAPVGTRWAQIVRDDASQRPFDARALWVNDGSHPSKLGSYLAAATLLRTIIDAPISPSGFTAGLSERDAAYLRSIADSTFR